MINPRAFACFGGWDLRIINVVSFSSTLYVLSGLAYFLGRLITLRA